MSHCGPVTVPVKSKDYIVLQYREFVRLEPNNSILFRHITNSL